MENNNCLGFKVKGLAGMEKKMETSIMEIQTEKNVEHEMDSGHFSIRPTSH